MQHMQVDFGWIFQKTIMPISRNVNILSHNHKCFVLISYLQWQFPQFLIFLSWQYPCTSLKNSVLIDIISCNYTSGSFDQFCYQKFETITNNEKICGNRKHVFLLLASVHVTVLFRPCSSAYPCQVRDWLSNFSYNIRQ